MKRELAFALEAQSQVNESLGRTRSSKPVDDDNNKGSVDQSPEIRVSVSKCTALNVYKRNKRLKKSVENDCVSVSVAEIPKEDAPTEVFPKSELKEVAKSVEVCRRFTRSLLKVANVVMDEKEVVLKKEEEVVAKDDGNGNENEVECKVPKIIKLDRKPTNVRELLETGLLEDYPVYYNGCGKKESALRGEIKSTGILCYCSSCKGSTVVAPSVFEIHACKVYKRASQYICLENGKSLLEVVKACNKYSLGTLTTNVQKIIGPLTTNEPITCQHCKGTFQLACAGNCDACKDSLALQDNPMKTTEVEAWSPSPAVISPSTSSAKVCSSSLRSSKRNLFKKSSGPDLTSLSSKRASLRVLSQERCQKDLTEKSSRSVLVSESPGVSLAHDLSQSKSNRKVSKKIVTVSIPCQQTKSEQKFPKNMALAPKSPQSDLVQNKRGHKPSKKLSKSVPPQTKSKTASSSRWKITKKDQKLHRLVFQKDGLPNGTEVAYFSNGKKLLEGYKMGAGIFCRCCSSEISPSQFEAHAGWASRRKPYSYIYISNGVSLHEYALSLMLKRNKIYTKENDDLCVICADGGNLLLCDGCPRSFHKECASLPIVPRCKWYCKFCQNMFQREKFVEYNANAIAAGRVSGVDLIGQITERCIRIVKNPEEAEVIACVLCRGYDFSQTGFGPRTVILCDQCEKEYHVGCLKKNKMADLKELPKGEWFCCEDCKRIFSTLQISVMSGYEKLPDSLLHRTKKKQEDMGLKGVTDLDVSWRLLNAKISSHRLLLSEAVAIFHDCFDPIVDSVSGRDFIPAMVYGRNIRGQDFGGMYCAILTVNSSIVSAGLLRIFGSDVAELPLIATTKGNQGKGYFQLLFSCIEKLLAFLKVRSCVLPAAEEAESLWIERFGFRKIPSEQLNNYRKRCWQMLTFEGTSMLGKSVPQCRITREGVVMDIAVKDTAVDTCKDREDTDVVDVLHKDQSANGEVSVVDQDASILDVEYQDTTDDTSMNRKDADEVDGSLMDQSANVVEISIEDQDASVEHQFPTINSSTNDKDTDVDVSPEDLDANVVEAFVDGQDMNLVEVFIEHQSAQYMKAVSVNEEDMVMVDASVLEQGSAVVDTSVLEQGSAGVDASVLEQGETVDASIVEQDAHVDASFEDQAN